MGQKERYKRQLISTRQMSETLLSAFKTPADWVLQIHPKANHALWFAGHMATADNFFISMVDPSAVREMTELNKLFGMGSQPSSNPADYGSPESVLAEMRERREKLLALLDSLDEAGLSKPTPPGSPDFLPDIASIFETAIWHEGMHSGQLSMIRRALGHEPIMGNTPAPST